MKTTAVAGCIVALMAMVWLGCASGTQNVSGTNLLAAEPLGSNRKGAGTTTNVIIVTLDGMRWQEVFGGFDPMLATEESGGVRNAAPLRAAFARDSAEESRAAILPFFWEVVAKRGQVFGDRGVKNV